jgi:hypothetical protein
MRAKTNCGEQPEGRSRLASRQLHHLEDVFAPHPELLGALKSSEVGGWRFEQLFHADFRSNARMSNVNFHAV